MSFLHQVFRFMYPLLKILHASHQPHRFLHTDELTASEMMRLPAPAHARPRDILPLVIARGLCWQWHDELQQHWAHQVLSRFSTAGCTVAVNQLNRCPNIFFEENRCPNINEVCWKTKFAQWYGQLICLPEIRIISISFLPIYYLFATWPANPQTHSCPKFRKAKHAEHSAASTSTLDVPHSSSFFPLSQI
jgi:hypothetical protein